MAAGEAARVSLRPIRPGRPQRLYDAVYAAVAAQISDGKARSMDRRIAAATVEAAARDAFAEIGPKPASPGANERQLSALALRKRGFTLKEIGAQLGVSRERARQMITAGTRKLRA